MDIKWVKSGILLRRYRRETIVLPLKNESAALIGVIEGNYEYKQITDLVKHIRWVKESKRFLDLKSLKTFFIH